MYLLGAEGKRIGYRLPSPQLQPRPCSQAGHLASVAVQPGSHYGDMYSYFYVTNIS